MASELFVKIDADILKSSLMRCSVETRWVFLVCLVLADADGRFRGDAFTISRFGNVPEDEVEAALDVLSSPDPYSSTPDHDGRRLIRLTEDGPNEWLIPNKAKYRGRHGKAEWREQEAKRKREAYRRARVSGEEDTDTDIDIDIEISGRSPEVSGDLRRSPDTSGRTEPAPKPKKKTKTGTVAQSPPTVNEVAEYIAGYMKKIGANGENPAQDFYDHFLSNGWKVGKGGTPMRDWKAACRTWVRNNVKWGKLHVTAEPTGDEWLYESYRRSDLDAHGSDPDWQCYIEWASDYCTENGPRTAPSFESFKKGV